MATETIGACVLPSGRCVKFRKLTLPLIENINSRAALRAGKHADAVMGTQAFGKEKVLHCLTAITAEPVDEVERDVQATEEGTGKPLLDGGKPVMVPERDDDAMIKSVEKGAGGGWTPLSYQTLIEEGPTSFSALFDDEIEDYFHIKEAIDLLSYPRGRGRAVGLPPKVRTVSAAR